MQPLPNFNDIVENFCFEGDFLDAVPYGTGHINATYAIRFRGSDGVIRRYILQKINTQVFKVPEQMMHNIEQESRFGEMLGIIERYR